MEEPFAAQAAVPRRGLPGKEHSGVPIDSSGTTTFEKVLIAIILLSLTVFFLLLGGAPFLLVLMIQPLLLGGYAKGVHHRTAIVWTSLTLLLNIGIVTFFEAHMSTYSAQEFFAESCVAECMSTIIIITVFVLLNEGGSTMLERYFCSHLRKGVFRLWVVGSGLWLMICAMQFYLHCSRYDCKFFVRNGRYPLSYLDLGELFVGIPAFVFFISLAACCAIEGFRIRAQTDSTGPTPSVETLLCRGGAR